MAKNKSNVNVDGSLGFVLFMAYAGAVVFFIERNVGFWGDLFAFLQAAAWPAYVLFYALRAFGV